MFKGCWLTSKRLLRCQPFAKGGFESCLSINENEKIMDMRRVVLYGALVWVLFSLWTAWNVDYPKVVPEQILTEPVSSSFLTTASAPVSNK